MVDLVSERSDDLAAVVAAGAGSLSPDQVAKGTEVDVNILEEGEVAETTSPRPYGVKGQPNLMPATYWLGRS